MFMTSVEKNISTMLLKNREFH